MQVSGKKFDRDPYSGKPKILFIGLPHSTHTQSWIDLLTGSEFNIRLFGVPAGYPPPTWRIRTYVTTSELPEGLDPDIRRCLHPTPEEQFEYQELEDRPWSRLKRDPVYLGFALMRKALDSVGSLLRMPHLYQELARPRCLPGKGSPVLPPQPKAGSPEAWLAQIIQEWQPDIIHTLGLDHDQGGFFYYGIRKSFGLEKYGKWVLQLRGGSDLTLNRHDPEMRPRIAEVLRECDQIISDNVQNIFYADEMGVPKDKFASVVPVPGTGGIDVDTLAKGWRGLPSERRTILWPKAYNCPWSVALPVFEAIRTAWEGIKPCSIHMLCMTPDARMWYNALPSEIKRNCFVYERIPRQEVLSLMQQSRVMLAPSLVDGVPNSLYEAMAAGAFPIVSPLESISSVVHKKQNVLFARNLYPQEIAEAMIEGMNDDALVDSAAQKNLDLVRKLADRSYLGPRIVRYYSEIAEKGGKEWS